RVIDVQDRPAGPRIVHPRAERSGGNAGVVNRNPVMRGKDIIRIENVLSRSIVTVEGVHPKAVVSGLDRHQYSIACGDYRRAVMSSRGGIEINCRGPLNRVQVLGGSRIDGCVL